MGMNIQNCWVANKLVEYNIVLSTLLIEIQASQMHILKHNENSNTELTTLHHIDNNF